MKPHINTLKLGAIVLWTTLSFLLGGCGGISGGPHVVKSVQVAATQKIFLKPFAFTNGNDLLAAQTDSTLIASPAGAVYNITPYKYFIARNSSNEWNLLRGSADGLSSEIVVPSTSPAITGFTRIGETGNRGLSKTRANALISDKQGHFYFVGRIGAAGLTAPEHSNIYVVNNDGTNGTPSSPLVAFDITPTLPDALFSDIRDLTIDSNGALAFVGTTIDTSTQQIYLSKLYTVQTTANTNLTTAPTPIKLSLPRGLEPTLGTLSTMDGKFYASMQASLGNSDQDSKSANNFYEFSAGSSTATELSTSGGTRHVENIFALSGSNQLFSMTYSSGSDPKLFYLDQSNNLFTSISIKLDSSQMITSVGQFVQSSISDNDVFFTANLSGGNWRIYKIDKSPASSTSGRLLTIYNGTTGVTITNINSLVLNQASDTLYFIGTASGQQHVYKITGVNDGGTPSTPTDISGSTNFNSITNLIIEEGGSLFNSNLFFAGTDSSGKTDVYQVQGTSSVVNTTSSLSAAGNSITSLISDGKFLYFSLNQSGSVKPYYVFHQNSAAADSAQELKMTEGGSSFTKLTGLFKNVGHIYFIDEASGAATFYRGTGDVSPNNGVPDNLVAYTASPSSPPPLSSLVFDSTGTNGVIIGTDGSSNKSLYTLSSSGSAITQITDTVSPGFTSIQSLSISDNGSIYFIGTSSGTKGVYRVSGGTLTNLTASLTLINIEFLNTLSSVSSNKVYFVGRNAGGKDDLYLWNEGDSSAPGKVAPALFNQPNQKILSVIKTDSQLLIKSQTSASPDDSELFILSPLAIGLSATTPIPVVTPSNSTDLIAQSSRTKITKDSSNLYLQGIQNQLVADNVTSSLNTLSSVLYKNAKLFHVAGSNLQNIPLTDPATSVTPSGTDSLIFKTDSSSNLYVVANYRGSSQQYAVFKVATGGSSSSSLLPVTSSSPISDEPQLVFDKDSTGNNINVLISANLGTAKSVNNGDDTDLKLYKMAITSTTPSPVSFSGSPTIKVLDLAFMGFDNASNAYVAASGTSRNSGLTSQYYKIDSANLTTANLIPTTGSFTYKGVSVQNATYAEDGYGLSNPNFSGIMINPDPISKFYFFGVPSSASTPNFYSVNTAGTATTQVSIPISVNSLVIDAITYRLPSPNLKFLITLQFDSFSTIAYRIYKLVGTSGTESLELVEAPNGLTITGYGFYRDVTEFVNDDLSSQGHLYIICSDGNAYIIDDSNSGNN